MTLSPAACPDETEIDSESSDNEDENEDEKVMEQDESVLGNSDNCLNMNDLNDENVNRSNHLHNVPSRRRRSRKRTIQETIDDNECNHDYNLRDRSEKRKLVP